MQLRQVDAAAAAKVPLGHGFVKAERPIDEHAFPAGQVRHLEVPLLGWYMPTAQRKQAALPVEAEYSPEAQLKQLEESVDPVDAT